MASNVDGIAPVLRRGRVDGSTFTAPTEVYPQSKQRVSSAQNHANGALLRMLSDCANSSAQLVPNPNAPSQKPIARAPSAVSTSPTKGVSRSQGKGSHPSKVARNLSFRPQEDLRRAEGAAGRPNALMKSVTAPSVVATKVKESGRDLVNAMTKSRSMMSTDTSTSNRKPVWYSRHLAPFEIVSMGVHAVKGTPHPTRKDAPPLLADTVLVGDYFRVRVKTANGKELPLDPMAYSVTLRLFTPSDPQIGKPHCRMYCPDKPAVMEYALYEVPNVADVIDIVLRIWLASNQVTSNGLPFRIKIGRGNEKDSQAAYTEPFLCLAKLPGQRSRKIPKYTPMIAGPARRGRGALVRVNTDITATTSRKHTSGVQGKDTLSSRGQGASREVKTHWVAALFTDPFTGLYRVPPECEFLLGVLADPQKCESFRPTAKHLLMNKKPQQTSDAAVDSAMRQEKRRLDEEKSADQRRSKRPRGNWVYRKCDEDAAVAALMRVGSGSAPDLGGNIEDIGDTGHVPEYDDDTASTKTADTMIYTGE